MKINRSPRGGPHWVCVAPDFQRQDAKTLPSLTYVLLWMSMAQRQRITDDSSVQIPKVRAWRPFTVEQKKPRVSRGESQGSLQTPLTYWWFMGGRLLSLNSLQSGRGEALGLHMVTRRNGRNSTVRTVQLLFRCLQLGGGIPRVRTQQRAHLGRKS